MGITKNHMIALAAGLAIGYAFASTLYGYQPFTTIADKSVSLVTGS